MLITVSTEASLTNTAEIYDPAADRWTKTAIQRDGGVAATLLANGRVLLTGTQCDRTGPQIYDPRTDSVSSAGVPGMPGYGGYSATLLQSGKVLFAGGYGRPKDVNTQPQNLVQVYDPISHIWTEAPPMPTERMNPRSLLLTDGRVLITGGTGPQTPGNAFLTSADIFDPRKGVWAPAGEIPTNAYGSSALSILGNGMVVAAGGGEDGRPTSSAYLFNPSTGAWSPTTRLAEARSGAAAMKMADGEVMIVGGQGLSGVPLTSAERFDPATDKWVAMPGRLATSGLDQTAVMLNDGRVLVSPWPDFVFGHWADSDVQIFDPRAGGSVPSPSQAAVHQGAWSTMPDISAPSGDFVLSGGGFSSTATATLLKDGRVLVVGTSPNAALLSGQEITGGIAAAIYDPTNGRSQPLTNPTTIASWGFTTTLLRDGRILVVGGNAELYDPETGQWSPVATTRIARFGHTATLLSDGRVLVAGGLGPSGGGFDDLTSADIYDPKSNSWSAAGDMPAVVGGGGTTATLLHDGRVLVVAGSSSAFYDPQTKSWSLASSLAAGHAPHTATLLSDGKVLILGGCLERPFIYCDRFAAPEVFDPTKNHWSQESNMHYGREAFSATLLRNGLVLVAGGYGPQFVSTSAELYDPAADSWTSAGEMNLARAGETATLLRSGNVLVVGGYFLSNLRSVELYIPPPFQRNSTPAAAAEPSATTLLASNWLLTASLTSLAVIVVVTLVVRLLHRRRRQV